jgi:hypothetical protein
MGNVSAEQVVIWGRNPPAASMGYRVLNAHLPLAALDIEASTEHNRISSNSKSSAEVTAPKSHPFICLTVTQSCTGPSDKDK